MTEAAGGLTLPEVVTSSNVRHLSRSAQVIILKEIKNFHEPGSPAFAQGSSRSDADLFMQEAEEFLMGSKPVLIQVDKMTTDVDEQYVYFMHVAQNITQEEAIKMSSDLQGNMDIAGISGTSSVETTSSAEVTLKNPNQRYIYKRHPFKKGRPIFESNDIVWIDLPDMNGKLRRVFTGLVTAVTQNMSLDGSINNTITLSCEDATKVLKQNRTNIRPSANLSEAGTALSGFENRFQGKRVHEILEEVLGLAYSKFYVRESFQQKINAYRQTFASASNDAIRGEAAQNETTAFVGELQDYVERKSGTVNVTSSTQTGTLFTSGKTSQQVPEFLMGFRLPKGTGASLTSPSETMISSACFGKNLFSSVSPLVRRPSDLAWVVTGTSQPAYQLTVVGDGAIDFYISEWKSNYMLVQELAKVLLFEFFADARGVIWFRPLNTALPAPNPSPDSLYEKGRPGGVYWIDPSMVVRQSDTTSDAGLITVQYVRGRWYYGNVGEAPWMIGGSVDSKRLLKFGPRQGPQWQVTGLQTPQACALYAQNLLDRVNAKVDASTVTLKGDSRLEAGNFCYLPHRAMCFYISNIRYDYRPGAAYDMTLTLSYGREIIAMTNKKMVQTISLLQSAGYRTLASEMKTRTISKVIQQLSSTGEVDPITRLPATNKTPAARLRELTSPTDTKDTLIVDGYYFEDMAEFLYDDLTTEQVSSRLVSEMKAVGENFISNAPSRQEGTQKARAATPGGTPAAIATAVTASDVNTALKEISGRTASRT